MKSLDEAARVQPDDHPFVRFQPQGTGEPLPLPPAMGADGDEAARYLNDLHDLGLPPVHADGPSAG